MMKVWLCVELEERLVDVIADALIAVGIAPAAITVVDHIESEERSDEEDSSAAVSKTT